MLKGNFLIVLVVGLTGCASLGNEVQQSNTLVTAVDALTQAEADLYDQIIAVSAARQRIAFERAFVTKDRNAADAAALYRASPPGDYAKAKAIRLQVLNQLSNYAQQINAIATSASTAWPASEATETVSETGSLVTALFGGMVPAYASNAIGIVNSIAGAITEAKAAQKVEDLAASAERAIEQIQTMIANDNLIINTGIVQGLVPAQQIDEGAIVQALYAQPGDSLARLRLVRSLSSTLSPPTTLLNKQQAVSDAIKKIVGANQALAAKKTQSATDLINQAVAAANQAVSTAKTSSTKRGMQ